MDRDTSTGAVATTQDSSMSRFIKIDNYNRYEEGHPAYQEMMNVVVKLTEQAAAAAKGKHTRARIGEIGAGTGNYTRRIGKKLGVRVISNEIDPESIAYLKNKIGSGEIENTKLTNGDFFHVAGKRIKSGKGRKFEVINSTFADHHFTPEKKLEFLDHIKKLLSDDGAYIMGDEFLPPHDEKDVTARVNAQIDYHGMIIEQAFKEGKVELPKLELDALISGLRTTVRFIQQTDSEQAGNSFAVESAANNTYNAEAVEKLEALAKRLEEANTSTLENPEELTGDIPDQRTNFIASLRKLKADLLASRRAGLEETESMVGGDYKMTIRQYADFLEKAGFAAQGYFEGPNAGDKTDDLLDEGEAQKPIALNAGETHMGGIWVIKAMPKSLEGESRGM